MNPTRTLAGRSILALYLALAATAARAPMALADDPAASKAADADLKALQGTWECVALEREGNETPPENLKGSLAVYEGNRLTLYRDGDPYRLGLVTLNPAAKPKAAINTWDLNGPYADRTLPGIYSIEGDTLKLCYAHAGEDRPTEFTTKSGPGFLCLTYKRKKP